MPIINRLSSPCPTRPPRQNNTCHCDHFTAPIGDSMNLVIEQDANLYIANGTVASVEVINMGMTSPVAYGNSYVFIRRAN